MSWLFHPDLAALSSEEVLVNLSGAFKAAKIPEHQAVVILRWLKEHPQQWGDWPWGVLISRVWEVFTGKGPMALAKGAKKNTINRLVDVFGQKFGDPTLTGNDADPIPFDAPPPRLEWEGKGFKFTLQAAFGMRSDCERVAKSMGGRGENEGRIDYVIVGFLGEYERYRSGSMESAVESHYHQRTISVRISPEGVHPLSDWRMSKEIFLLSEREWLQQVWPYIAIQSGTIV